MFIATVFTAAAAATPAAGAAGTASYERPGAVCPGYIDVLGRPTPEAAPYRGQEFHAPLHQGTAGNRPVENPPGFPEEFPRGFRATATGSAEVAPDGQIVRVTLTSPEDGRFAAHAVGRVAFWRYRPIPDGRLCRRVNLTFKWTYE
jgi:hypothetical protein